MIQCDCNIIVVSSIQLLVNKNLFQILFFSDLMVEKCEINRIQKCTPFSLEMFKIALASGAPPHTPLGSLRRSPKPPSREGLLAFGNRSFAPSALNSH